MKSMPKSIWLEVNSKYTVCTPHIYIHTDIIWEAAIGGATHN